MPSIPHAYAEISKIRHGNERSYVDLSDGTYFCVPNVRGLQMWQHDRVLVDLSDVEQYGLAHVTVLRVRTEVDAFGSTEMVQSFNIGKDESGLLMGAASHC